MASDITVSLWFRATRVDTGNAAELVSGAGGYVIRLRSGGLEVTKRTQGISLPCGGNIPSVLDGRWHHVAGVFTRTSVRGYHNGTEFCSYGNSDEYQYNSGAQLSVGRHADATQYDFDGNLDEVRIYNRALSRTEVTALAAGQNL